MAPLVLSPRCAVVPMAPGVLLVIWCVWHADCLTPAEGHLWARTPDATICCRIIRSDLAPRSTRG